MGFPKQTAGVFTKANVETITEGQMGCYGLYKPSQWIYVGKGDIRTRLLAHLNNDNPCITTASPTHWVSEVTANYDAREKELIIEFNPACNKKIG